MDNKRVKEKIVYINTAISKKLHDEINYAKNNLNKNEQEKIRKKKHRYTFLEASHKLGKHLNSKRDSNK